MEVGLRVAIALAIAAAAQGEQGEQDRLGKLTEVGYIVLSLHPLSVTAELKVTRLKVLVDLVVQEDITLMVIIGAVMAVMGGQGRLTEAASIALKDRRPF